MTMTEHTEHAPWPAPDPRDGRPGEHPLRARYRAAAALDLRGPGPVTFDPYHDRKRRPWWWRTRARRALVVGLVLALVGLVLAVASVAHAADVACTWVDPATGATVNYYYTCPKAAPTTTIKRPAPTAAPTTAKKATTPTTVRPRIGTVPPIMPPLGGGRPPDDADASKRSERHYTTAFQACEREWEEAGGGPYPPNYIRFRGRVREIERRLGRELEWRELVDLCRAMFDVHIRPPDWVPDLPAGGGDGRMRSS